MAQQDQIRLKFSTASGDKTWTFRYARPEATTQQVKNLVDTMLEHGEIYKYPPLAIQSAQLYRVQISDYLLDN